MLPHVPVKTTNYSRNLDSHIKAHSQYVQWREGQENLEWNGVNGLLIHLPQSSSTSLISMKNRLLNVGRTNYALKVTQWNKVCLIFLNFSGVHASGRLFHCDYWNWTMYSTWPSPLTHWNWWGCCYAVPNWFWIFNITCVALLVKQWNFPIYKNKHRQQLYWSVLATCAHGRRAKRMESSANQDLGLSAFNSVCASYVRAMKYMRTFYFKAPCRQLQSGTVLVLFYLSEFSGKCLLAFVLFTSTRHARTKLVRSNSGSCGTKLKKNLVSLGDHTLGLQPLLELAHIKHSIMKQTFR